MRPPRVGDGRLATVRPRGMVPQTPIATGTLVSPVGDAGESRRPKNGRAGL